MAKAHFGRHGADRVPRGDWRKAMSDNVAYALLIYTGLQIFLTMNAIKDLAKATK